MSTARLSKTASRRYAHLLADGCVIVPAGTLGPQVHAGEREPDQRLFCAPEAAVKRRGYTLPHQAAGRGFWTARLQVDGHGVPTSTYLEQLRHQVPRAAAAKRLWRVFPSGAALVLVISGVETLQAAVRHFATDGEQGEEPAAHGRRNLDLARIAAAGLVGVHVTEQAIAECPDLQLGWNCESTCWVRWCFRRRARELGAGPPVLPPVLAERFADAIAAGCIVWPASALPPQGHIGEEEPDRRRFVRPSTRAAFPGYARPRNQSSGGGFWTANLLRAADGRAVSSYEAVMRAKYPPEWFDRCGLWEMRPDFQAPVLVLADRASYEAAVQRYANETGWELDPVAVMHDGFAGITATETTFRDVPELESFDRVGCCQWLAWAFPEPPIEHRPATRPGAPALPAVTGDDLAASRHRFYLKPPFAHLWIEVERGFRNEIMPEIIYLHKRVEWIQANCHPDSPQYRALRNFTAQILTDYRITGHNLGDRYPVGRGLFKRLAEEVHTPGIAAFGSSRSLAVQLAVNDACYYLQGMLPSIAGDRRVLDAQGRDLATIGTEDEAP